MKGTNGMFMWSPDGKRIAFAARHNFACQSYRRAVSHTWFTNQRYCVELVEIETEETLATLRDTTFPEVDRTLINSPDC